jgi:hypothetical protein
VTQDKFAADQGWAAKGSWRLNGVLAQMDPVTRAENGCPDTVELIAVLPNTAPGQVVQIEVTFEEGVFQPLQMVAGPVVPLDQFRIECVDQQNRAYNLTLSPENGVTVKNGPYQTITRYAGTLQGSGVELLGAIVFLTKQANSQLYDLDLFLHNGLADHVVGGIYFKSLTLFGLSGQTFYPKTCSKRPCGNGGVGQYNIAINGEYFWPKQAGLTRRFLVSPVGHVANRRELRYRQEFGGIAFHLDWNDSFGVAKTGVGHVTNTLTYWGQPGGAAYHGRDGLIHRSLDTYNAIRTSLETGEMNEGVGIYTDAYGPFHPFFIPSEGGVGGFWISHYVGTTLCVEEYAEHALVAAMNVERQPWVTLHSNGTPKTAADYAAEGGGTIQFDFAPFFLAINGIPAFKNATDYNVGNANREIETYSAHDASHQCRYNKPLQSLAYGGNDYLAKELLHQSAEINLLWLHLYPAIPGWSGGQSLAVMLEKAAATPHQGGILDRARCWGAEAVLMYYSLASPAWRENLVAWRQAMTQVITQSQMPTGWNHRVPGDSGNQVVVTAGLPTQYDIGQTFEIEFEDWLKRALLVTYPVGSANRVGLNRSILRSAKSFFETAISPEGNYMWYIAVGNNHGLAFTPEQLQFALTAGNAEIWQGWFVLNHAYLASQEMKLANANMWLMRALPYYVTAPSYAAKRDQLSQMATAYYDDHFPQAMGLMHSFEQNGGGI